MQVWVVNKTGVSLAYKVPDKAKKEDEGKHEHAEQPKNLTAPLPKAARYRTDGDTMLFSK